MVTESGRDDPARQADLTGRVALVTGGSRGLGREIALAFARAGADICIASRKPEAGAATAAEIRAYGRRALFHPTDAEKWNDLDRLVESVYAEFGRVDILVNNAGKSPPYSSLSGITEESLDRVLALNLKAPFRLTALVAERMAAGVGGSVINISSVNATRPDPAAAPYSAAKAGLNILTSTFALTYAPKVRVNGIVPGPFATDISTHWTQGQRDALAGGTLLGRVGRPEEILGAALYLAGDASSFTTGSLLTVDGGYSVGPRAPSS